jgi:hypothetical protein
MAGANTGYFLRVTPPVMAGKAEANGAGLTPYGFKAVRKAPGQTAHVRLRIFNGREMKALSKRHNFLVHYPFLCLKGHSLFYGRNMHSSGQMIIGLYPFSGSVSKIIPFLRMSWNRV